MKKYFVVSDVHSFFDEMMEALNKSGYDKENPDHIFVSLGDLFDRGKKPKECLKFVNSIPFNRKILICGNHENLAEDIIAKGYFSWADVHNGTKETFYLMNPSAVDDFDAIAKMRDNEIYKKYIRSLELYKEINNYVFVHGWIPCNKLSSFCYSPIDWRSEKDNVRLWEEASWFNGMKAWDCGVRDEKTICCGHWHCSWGNYYLHGDGTEFGEGENFNPFIDDGIIAIDACTVHTHKVNCVVLEEE